MTATAATQPQFGNQPGVLTDTVIHQLREEGAIQADAPFLGNQIQPASLDLRLGKTAYRVRAGFMPSDDQTVREKMENFLMHEVDLTDGAVLEVGAVYLVELQESLNLPAGVSGTVSPKSSTGRLDIFTRLLADKVSQFDTVPPGYSGSLWIEIVPQTFGILAREGVRLNQLRLRQGMQLVNDQELEQLHAEEPLVYLEGDLFREAKISNGLWLSVDLEGRPDSNIVGYRAKKHAPLIDLYKIKHYAIEEFWEPVYRPSNGYLILNPGDFYILASREKLCVPPQYSCEMIAFDQTVGELRAHYAGFFDPGFGYAGSGMPGGTTAVLEVRAHEAPFVLEHGQRICRMVYEPLCDIPEVLYGQELGSNYAGQRLKLAKQFRMDD